MDARTAAMTPKGWLTLLSEIADEADTLALKYSGRNDLGVSVKEDDSPVTEADQAIEAAARKVMAHRAPGVGVYGEEEGETGPTDRRLIIDPIDATRNFMRGIRQLPFSRSRLRIRSRASEFSRSPSVGRSPSRAKALRMISSCVS